MKAWGAILVLLAAPAVAADRPMPYAVDGKIVRAACLEAVSFGDSSRFDPVDIGKCPKSPRAAPSKAMPDMIGYEIAEGGFFYYRYLGRQGAMDVIYSLYSGGGSGTFSSLIGVQLQGSTLRLKEEYAGGDRCNGGVTNARLTQGRLSWDQKATPADMVELGDKSLKIEAYKDLEASAASCVADVHFTDGAMTGVTLTETEWDDNEGWTEMYRYQACFNRLYRETVGKAAKTLSVAQAREFSHRFARACMKARPQGSKGD